MLLVVPLYKGSALTALYDCLSVLSQCKGFDNYCNEALGILNAHWANIKNTERRLLPFLECFDNCVRALGESVSALAEPIFMRCVELTKTQDYDFVQRAFNLIASLTTAIKQRAIPFVSNSGLMPQILNILNSKNDYKQLVFCLLGDIQQYIID
jgi:hypothetical protein